MQSKRSMRILRNHKQDGDHIYTNLCLQLQNPKGYIYKNTVVHINDRLLRFPGQHPEHIIEGWSQPHRHQAPARQKNKIKKKI